MHRHHATLWHHLHRVHHRLRVHYRVVLLHDRCQRCAQTQLVGHAALQLHAQLPVAQHAPLRMLYGYLLRAFRQIEPYLAHLVATLHDAEGRGERKVGWSNNLYKGACLAVKVAHGIDERAHVGGQFAETLHREGAVCRCRGTQRFARHGAEAQNHDDEPVQSRCRTFCPVLSPVCFHIFHSRLKSEMSITPSLPSTVADGCHVRTWMSGMEALRKSHSRNRYPSSA